MKKIKVIDRGGIYACSPDIKKKYANPFWGLVMSAIGAGLVVLWFLSPAIRANGAASGWILGLGVCGLLVAVTLVCYYLFGDCKKPYYKPSKSVMDRYEHYYDAENSRKAAEYLMDGDFAAIARLPRAHQPLHMLVMYRSEGGEFLAAQMVDATGVAPHAMGEIEIFEKGAYDMPATLING